MLGIAWYYIKDKRINCIIFAALALLCFFVPASIFYTLPLRCFSPLYFNISDLFIDGQWCMCLALPFMLLYDGEKGHSMKYFFYIYYPIHVYVLLIISQLRSASFWQWQTGAFNPCSRLFYVLCFCSACCFAFHSAYSRCPSSLSKNACISGSRTRARASTSW